MTTATMSFKVRRSGDLGRQIKNYHRRAEGAEERINDAAYRGIYIRCPVGTGYMRSTILKIKTEAGSGVRVGAFYGIYVNQGTRNKVGQWFFTQGVRIDGINQLKHEARTLFR